MKFLITVLVYSLLINAVKAKEDELKMQIISGENNVPLELNLILNDLQSYDSKVANELLPLIKKIDLLAQDISMDEFFLIGKMEIYKTLLKNNSDKKITKNWKPITTESVNFLKLATEKSKYSSLKWLFSALEQDAQSLLSAPLYKEIVQLKHQGVPLGKPELLKLAKKSELISFWINIIPSSSNISSSNEFTDFIMTKFKQAIYNIHRSLTLFHHETNFSSKADETKLHFFTLSTRLSPKAEINPQQNSSKTTPDNKSVDTILAPVLEAPELPAPLPQNDDWLKEEMLPPSLQELPQPVNDASWLENL